MTNTENLPTSAATYLSKMAQALGSLPAQERSAILEETKAHLLDTLSHGGTKAIDKTLSAFGAAESYAGNFVEIADIRSAVARKSGPAMFQHTLKLATCGIGYFFSALIAFILYVCAASFAVIALMKPIMPQNVGLWVSDANKVLSAGFLPSENIPQATEILGYWIIPIAAVTSIILFVLGNVFTRTTLLRHLKKS